MHGANSGRACKKRDLPDPERRRARGRQPFPLIFDGRKEAPCDDCLERWPTDYGMSCGFACIGAGGDFVVGGTDSDQPMHSDIQIRRAFAQGVSDNWLCALDILKRKQANTSAMTMFFTTDFIKQ